ELRHLGVERLLPGRMRRGGEGAVLDETRQPGLRPVRRDADRDGEQRALLRQVVAEATDQVRNVTHRRRPGLSPAPLPIELDLDPGSGHDWLDRLLGTLGQRPQVAPPTVHALPVEAHYDSTSSSGSFRVVASDLRDAPVMVKTRPTRSASLRQAVIVTRSSMRSPSEPATGSCSSNDANRSAASATVVGPAQFAEAAWTLHAPANSCVYMGVTTPLAGLVASPVLRAIVQPSFRPRPAAARPAASTVAARAAATTLPGLAVEPV